MSTRHTKIKQIIEEGMNNSESDDLNEGFTFEILLIIIIIIIFLNFI